MCGRFHNHVAAMHEWVDILNDWPSGHSVGFNVSPTQEVPIVLSSGSTTARWGLVPKWEKNFSTAYPTHNARLETVAEKPSFRNAWKHARTCLIPVAGFYEWRKESAMKQPYFIHKPDDLLVLAGLWENWNDQLSFTILTTKSGGAVADLHHRMPVMLDAPGAVQWLSADSANDSILQDCDVVAALDYYPVSTQVNNSKSAGPHCAQRIELGPEKNHLLDF